MSSSLLSRVSRSMAIRPCRYLAEGPEVVSCSRAGSACLCETFECVAIRGLGCLKQIALVIG